MTGTGCVLGFNTEGVVPDAIQAVADITLNHVELITKGDGGWLSSGSVSQGFHPILLKSKIHGLVYGQDFVCYMPIYRGFNSTMLKIEVESFWRLKPYDYRGLTVVQFFWNTLRIWLGARNEKRALKRLYCYEALWYFHRGANIFKKWWKGVPKDSFPKDKFRLMTKSEFESLFINS